MPGLGLGMAPSLRSNGHTKIPIKKEKIKIYDFHLGM